MPNHVHLILVPGDELGLRDALGEADRRYTRRISFREGWRGHLWQERSHSFVMEERHLIAAARSVERNPVRARLCARPQDWPWSSTRAHLAAAEDELVSVRPLLELVLDWDRFIGEPDAPDIADLLYAHTSTGRPLGPDVFVEDLEQRLWRPQKRQKPGPALFIIPTVGWTSESKVHRTPRRRRWTALRFSTLRQPGRVYEQGPRAEGSATRRSPS
jgi:putative transposase